MHKSEARKVLLSKYGGKIEYSGQPSTEIQKIHNEIRNKVNVVIDSLADAIGTLRMSTKGVNEMINLIASRFRPHSTLTIHLFINDIFYNESIH